MKIYRQVQAVCAVSLITILAACSSQPVSPTPASVSTSGAPASLAERPLTTHADGLATASTAAPTRSDANFEINFLTNMIDHHHMAVMMAEMCMTKATHEQLRSLREDISGAQVAEIERMQGWLQGWYGVSHEPEMKPRDEKMMDGFASLTGAAFEIAFMEMMSEHHERALKEARKCLDKAYHPELRSLCENIIRTQSAEIAQMPTWLCEWYGESR